MECFIKLCLRFRVLVIVLAAIITVFLSYQLSNLEADDDVMQFMPQDNPDIALFNRVNERFGGLDVAIVGLESETLLSAVNIGKIRKLTQKIAGIDGVYDILSFADVPDPQPAPDGLRVEPLVSEKVPTDPKELSALRKRILSNKNAVGNLISKDGKAAMILCFLGGNRPPIHIAAEIKKQAAVVLAGENVFYGGAPFIRLHVAGGTREDLVFLTPVVVVVVLLVTFLMFRKPLGVLLALGSVGVAVVWLMGIIALTGKGLTVVGSSLPTIGMAIGGAYSIHILAAYFSGTADTVHARIIEAMKRVGAPVIVSAVTTCAGFMSFWVVDVDPLRDFGLFAALGVGFTGLLAVTVVPAILSFSKRVPQKLGTALLSKPLGKLGHYAQLYRRRTLAITVILGLVCATGVIRIAPDATLKSFFAKDSEPDKANQFLDNHFGGSIYLQVYFEGNMRSPFVLAQMRKVVEYARGMDQVVQVNSIIDHLSMMSEAMGGRADLPINHRRTGFLYPFLEGTSAINQMISPEKDASLVQIRLKDVGSEAVNQTVADLRQFIKKEVPRGLKIVKINDFSDEKNRQEYTTPEQYDAKGKLIKKSKLVNIETSADPHQLQKWENEWLLDVSKRVVRIARIHSDLAFSEKKVHTVAKVLSSKIDSKKLIETGDLNAQLGTLIQEYFDGDMSIFEAPAADAPAPLISEWQNRKKLIIDAVRPLVDQKVNIQLVNKTISEALPLISASDPEGLELTAAAMTNGLVALISKVRSTYLSGRALAALHIQKPSAILHSKIAWAITDLDQPVAAVADTGQNSSTVLARVTGQPVITEAFCNSTIENQLKTLSIALVLLALIMTVFFKSFIDALKGLAPAVFMLCMAVGVMGIAKIPLDLTTSMIAVIALGIGVDYAIHFLWRRTRLGETLAETEEKVGPSIASSAVQVAAGFSVLALSDMVPMQRFGMLVALTMLLAAAATFILLPALRAGRQNEKAVAEEQSPERLGLR